MSSLFVTRSGPPGAWTRIKDLVLPLALIASLLVIVVPLPAGIMDLLLAANITIAVIVLLTTLYVRTPLEFNIFPSLLLATTLFRLVLNVATTRLILTRADSDGLYAAGGVVRSFGEFVTGGGNEGLVVGLVIFAIIVLIQFVVITKGATRISEVAARFTLDGMPGKQMAVDADLAAGSIDEQEAQRRRREITQQADFFGAMDGAGKFVRGDAIAGLVIVLVNIIGGLFIGIVQNGMGLAQASELFTKLTIGDGLVTQIPAFLISLAAGMLVTRSSQETNLPGEFLRQLFSRPLPLAVAGGFLCILIFTSLPTVPLLLIGAGCFGLALVLARREKKVKAAEAQKQSSATRRAEQRVEDYLAVDPMELELGVGLIRLADTARGGDLLERIGRVRRAVAAEAGIIVPKVRVRDNMRLGPRQYRIKIADSAVALGEIDVADGDPAGAIAARLSETARRHADELLDRDAVKHLIDELKKTSPAVVDELIPGAMKLGEVQQVLQVLLREGVSIRQLGPILETLADWAQRTKDPVLLAERVRRRLARALSGQYRDGDSRLHVVTLDPALEQRIIDGVEHGGEGLSLRLPPQTAERICRAIEFEVSRLSEDGHRPVVLVGSRARPAVKRITAARLPRLVVLGYDEITSDTRVESVAAVPDPDFNDDGETSLTAAGAAA
ncbi:MAG: FHIPEP family type III secretion protein [Pirellulales bacterium]|nr:FHIPEP family type III secretion protein [Pirellulales bacterium]